MSRPGRAVGVLAAVAVGAAVTAGPVSSALVSTALAGPALVSTALTASAPTAARVLFTLHDARLHELSGIARGVVRPGVFYAQNDSGDSARFFALDARSGAVRAVVTVPGARNVDWEDLAVAPCGATSCVWLADTGDNDAQRAEVTVYRVPEPALPARAGATVTAARPAVWRLRYPDGPVDAEALAVSPSGRAVIVTKDGAGRSGVYAVPRRPDAAHVGLLRRVGSISVAAVPSLVPATLQREVTGAALSPNGAVLAVRTYTQALFWPVGTGGVAAAVRRAPTVVPLPLQPQGEGIAVDRDGVVLDSEQVGSAVLRVPLPAALRAAAGGPAVGGAVVGALDTSGAPLTSGTAVPATATAAAGPSSTVAPAPGGPAATPSRVVRPVSRTGGGTLAGVAVLLLVAGASIMFRRRGRRRRG